MEGIQTILNRLKSALPSRAPGGGAGGRPEAPRFGTFGGVFTPTLLTILGAIMYLREGWVVGNAGLVGALAIILLANVITISTGLSISSIATNIRVRAGGAFSIISQSLGLEVGGSVSLPFYLAQSIGAAFYVFAFTEGWLRIFPAHPAWLVVIASFGLAYIIAFISANLAVRAQFVIMAILALSLLSVFLGSFAIFGRPGLTQTPVLWGDFPAGDFWHIFAVFFPAVTGALAGVNMSGVLKDPRESIPKGTMAAIGLSFLIYLMLAYWLSRAASAEELVDNLTVMVDKALYGPAILAGILAATFSSALTSLVGAPRVLQAMAQHGVFPANGALARETATGEPRPAMYVTGGIAFAAVLFGLTGGGLNAIAPLMTMFFLITYAMLNGVMLLEQSLGLVSFRPLLRLPRVVPLVGLVGCLFVMFLINPAFSLVAVVVILALYAYLARRHLRAPWSDVRSGLFVTLAEWAAKQVSNMPASQEKAWKPSLLVPVDSASILTGSYRFLKALTYPRGSVRAFGLYPPGAREQVSGLEALARAFAEDGIFARVTLLETNDFAQGLRIGLEVLHGVFFRPNTLFMPVSPEMESGQLQVILDQASGNDMGAILFARHPVTDLGREQVINVWIREQSPDWEIGLRLSNLDLALLLAYQLGRNWRGTITLFTIVPTARQRASGVAFLDQLVSLGRMPRGTRTVVEVGALPAYLHRAPQADLNVFGLADRVNLESMWQMVETTNASCIFVRDSGHESALA